MTASAGAWYRVGTVNVTKNNAAVTGVGSSWQNDVIAIAIGDAFTIDAKTWYEVIAVDSDTSITLDRGFEGTTASGTNYAILRNTSGTILTRIAGQIAVQFNQKQLFLDELRTWLNSTNASEELTDSHGLKRSLKTPAQMVADHDNRLAELDEIHPYPWAMRKVEFEANRKQNNEMFAASGFVHFGKHSTNLRGLVNQGLYIIDTTGYQSELFLGRELARLGESKFDYPVLNISGITTKLLMRNGKNRNTYELNSVKLPPAEDGTRTYDSATGNSVKHSTPAIAFASETATNKVVTDRVDMWGFEAFLREINDADPFVYANGLLQSLAADIDGITTVSDNVRPITYFAWYEGDENSRGRGVNWQTASEANRIKIASDPANNIYFDDETGKFYQWCVRGRSFAGAGNGDWGNLHTDIDAQYLDYSVSSPVIHLRPQGKNSTPLPDGAGFPLYSARVRVDDVSHPRVQESKGIFGAMFGISAVDTSAGINGECYFLVCGAVNRLNQGAYHPSFNSSGTAYSTNGINLDNRTFWDSSSSALTSTLDTFTNACTANFADGSTDTTSVNGRYPRPDGRFYDAIYASGQGGVCRDMRYSAWGLKAEDFAEADLAVKSGEYRGREKLKLTKIIKTTDSANAQGSGVSPLGGTEEFSVGDTVFVHGIDGVYRKRIISSVSHSTIIFSELVSRSASGTIVHEKETGISISEEYTHVDVIGDPVVILQTEDLKDGWQGSWIPIIPSGIDQEFKLTRPKISSLPVSRFGGGNGEIWEFYPTTHSWNTGTLQAANSFRNTMLVGTVVVFPYKTKARVTAKSANSVVYGGISGLGSICSTESSDLRGGAVLLYSLTSKVGTSSVSTNKVVEIPWLRAVIFPTTKLIDINSLMEHPPIPLAPRVIIVQELKP
ncbi:hypothetical protein [Pseudoalteromonas nigrifaciens]|uniref:hypothetical protein n=1 Tax=Pseudoalteromonas nigrifaciens TaxID=28109 RepID=UPI000E04D48B|nr:hypothetical protein [Pseudoalteromonas nigrifaciens]SUC52464.1 Uncharacterised protein [Pseudoalteromonas nigrifaciens]